MCFHAFLGILFLFLFINYTYNNILPSLIIIYLVRNVAKNCFNVHNIKYTQRLRTQILYNLKINTNILT